MKDRINILKLVGIIFSALMLVIILDFALKAIVAG
ncbi:hypothetical protein SAMN05878281_1390 [Salegentibacter salegens]|uniref:Uncharacterized protein n=1 Tax=Salegentibacter salegens TaxID=143223 RepID=A0A1M7KFN2_9FLAO|nr:hypothetical protein SAMN05878281_1390 [Salegentibacter salegens]